jgi:hypothetical protein
MNWLHATICNMTLRMTLRKLSLYSPNSWASGEHHEGKEA